MDTTTERDNTIITLVINLFAGIKEIPLKGLTNCTYQKTGVRGSRRITQSQVLPNFAISLLEEALQCNLQGDQSQVVTWLLAQLQASS